MLKYVLNFQIYSKSYDKMFVLIRYLCMFKTFDSVLHILKLVKMTIQYKHDRAKTT